MKSPIVRRKVFDNQKSCFEAEKRYYEREISDLKHDLTLAERAIKEILPRLVRLNEPIPSDFNTYRVCVDIHRDAVERALTHGSDDHMIKYFAHFLAYEVEKKMIQFNFARCSR